MLIPPSSNISSTDACDVVRELNAIRPQGTAAYQQAHLVMPIITACLYAIILPALYYLRHDAMFYRIRPFGVLLGVSLSIVFYSFSTLLPEAKLSAHIPCGFELAVHSMGSVMITTLVYIRALLFATETRYHQILLGKGIAGAGAADPNLDDGASTVKDNDDTSSSHRAGSTSLLLEWLQAYITAQRLTGLSPLDTIPFEAIANLRKHYGVLLAECVVVPFICLAIGFAAVPLYRSGCVDCPIFSELSLIVSSALVFTLVKTFGLMRTGSAMKQDDQGVLTELKYTGYFSTPACCIGYLVFHLFDPNEVQFRREFNGQILPAFVASVTFWCVGFVWPVWCAVQFRRQRNLAAAWTGEGDDKPPHSPPSMNRRSRKLTTIDNNNTVRSLDTLLFTHDADTRRQFYQFAAARYCMESLNFLEEESKFRDECQRGAKSVAWMRSRAARLVATFIRPGADQEVNISSLRRDEILSTAIQHGTDDAQLATLFVRAADEVFDMVWRGIWLDFKTRAARKAASPAQKQVVPIEA